MEMRANCLPALDFQLWLQRYIARPAKAKTGDQMPVLRGVDIPFQSCRVKQGYPAGTQFYCMRSQLNQIRRIDKKPSHLGHGRRFAACSSLYLASDVALVSLDVSTAAGRAVSQALRPNRDNS